MAQYIEGRPKPKHRAMTWPCSEYTKSEAQEGCDRIVREETGGTPRPDGSLTVKEFWEQIHFPTLKLRVSANTQTSYASMWKNILGPAIGNTELQHVNKSSIDAILNKLAIADRAESSITIVLSLIHGIFVEAVENGYIARNPAHRVVLPRDKAQEQTRALSEDEARKVFALPVNRGSLMFRIMLMTRRPNRRSAGAHQTI